jgi:hypothetical protein
VDSKVVNREIKKSIWPVLKAVGFARFTSRKAWRHNADSIDVLEFQSHNSYNAGVLDITTYSFSVNLGKYLLYVPPQWPPPSKDGVLLPLECGCIFRGPLMPQVHAARSSPNIWSIDADGRNLLWSMKDVSNQLASALEWFSRLDDRAEVLRILLEDKSDMRRLSGFGNNPSPTRSYHAGYVALSLGDRSTATTKLQEAVDSKCYETLFSNVDEAISRASPA